ncbi:hypothetical protein [Nocardiopsis salina]|uniref:hypothetical protein n=1 Tax=Nocardiopsis salina TaxID=245836 RepID=UPI000347DAB6|nr:hypothetical protein [Nocardiopsis salina]
MHVLRSHSKAVSATIFLTGFSTVAASTAFGALDPWEAAQLAACAALFAVCMYLALTLRRLLDETAAAHAEAEEQDLELTEVAAESREELSARMDGLVERLERAAVLTAEVGSAGHGGGHGRSTGSGSPERTDTRSETPAEPVEADGDSDAGRVWAEATEPARAAR